MKSPYSTKIEERPYREIPPEEENLMRSGYEFIGWNIEATSNKKLGDCINKAHCYHSAFPNAWKSVQHTPSGDDITQWCTICSIYWKVDMSE
tara:strand:+ start:276 stop:551 length:276 start_codon:yes stop_codon:yes gene_type:complete